MQPLLKTRKSLNIVLKNTNFNAPVLINNTPIINQFPVSNILPIYQIYPTNNYPTHLNNKGLLYLSNVWAAKDRPTIDSVNIKRIVNLYKCDYKYDSDDIKTMFIEMNDDSCQNLMPVICSVYPFIVDGLVNGENVLVHCYAGISRSVSIIIAFLMLHDPEWVDTIRIKPETDLDCLYRHIKSIKSDIEPNFGFVLQLESLYDNWDVYKVKNCKLN